MVFRVFSAIIGIVFFSFLVLVTFFSGNDSEIKPFLVDKTSTGVFKVSSGAIDQTDTIEGGFSLERITDFDTIYFKADSQYDISKNNQTFTLELGKGEFIFDINSLEIDYNITTSFFDAQLLGPGKVYINTFDTKNYSILAFDAIVKTDLKDDTDIVTSLHLYPHMYLRFNPLRARFLKNADLVRISSVFTLDYFPFSLSSQSTSYLSLLAKLGKDDGLFFENYLTFVDQDISERNSKLQEIRKVNIWEFPGVAYLKRYFYIFRNDSKKKAYYQNQAFNKLLTLIKSKQYEPEIIELFMSDLEKLSLYPEPYNQIKMIANNYYNLVLADIDASYLYSKMNLYSLLLKINDKSINKEEQSYLALSSLYFHYDNHGRYSYNNLISFVTDYTKSIGVFDPDLTSKKRNQIDYFSFFLSNVFLSKFSSADQALQELASEENLEAILEVMGGYIDVNNIIYKSTEDKRSVTGMYVHLDILDKLEDFMRNGLFKAERGENGILLKSRKFSVNNKEISLLKDNIDLLLNFYKKNRNFLSQDNQKDIILIKDYELLENKFKEYFLALTDYESYIFNYDETKKNLFGIKTFSQGSNEITITKENAMKYLSQFSGTSLSDLEIDIKEDRYIVSNFIVDGKNFGFDLHPFDNNKIDNIIINNKEISFSYKLDIVEEDFSEKIKNAKDKQTRQKYDFTQFFSNTFTDERADGGDDIFEIKNNNTGSQDKFVVVFKRDKLLGAQGEFSTVKSFLDIEFDDIDVVQNNEIFDIFINDADITIRGDKSEFTSGFESSYILAEDKHYFKNIKLYPYVSNLGVKRPEIGDNFIQVVGNINLADLKASMLEIANDYANVKYVYNSITKNLGVKQVSIRYLKSSKKLNFRFDYAGDFVSILLSDDTIENISQAGKVIVRDTNYRTIDDILKTIKK